MMNNFMNDYTKGQLICGAVVTVVTVGTIVVIGGKKIIENKIKNRNRKDEVEVVE